MPTILCDDEAADLIDAAVEMYEAALHARSQRADPDRIISDGLTLQGNKLRTVRLHLRQPEPPEWSLLDPQLRAKALSAMQMIMENPNAPKAEAMWRNLREVAIAPAFQTAAAARHSRLPKLEARNPPKKAGV